MFVGPKHSQFQKITQTETPPLLLADLNSIFAALLHYDPV